MCVMWWHHKCFCFIFSLFTIQMGSFNWKYCNAELLIKVLCAEQFHKRFPVKTILQKKIRLNITQIISCCWHIAKIPSQLSRWKQSNRCKLRFVRDIYRDDSLCVLSSRIYCYTQNDVQRWTIALCIKSSNCFYSIIMMKDAS